MEVKVESTGTVDAPEAYDPQSGKFTWTIKDFSRRKRKLYSDSFQVGGYRWRILVFPKGNNVDCLSMYLDVADSVLSHGWIGYAQFSLTVVNQLHNKFSIRKEASHQFIARYSDWGFTNFMPLSEMLDPSRGYVVNDTCVVEADVSVRLKKEQEEKEQNRKRKRMVNAAAHLYTIVKVARDADLFKQIGEDIFFDLVDHDKVRSFHIQNQLPFSAFKEEVAKELGVPVQYQRFWLWATRRNNTYRPNRPVTPQEEIQPVGQLREVSNKANSAELKLFLEVEIGQDFLPIALPEKSTEDLLLFFKLYDPSNGEFRYIGRFYVSAHGKPMDILTRLNEMAGFASDEEIELFEEIKFEPQVMCELVDKKSTFHANQLDDGDIICFQKTPNVGSVELFRYPDVPSFLEYVHDRQVVRFRSLEKPKEDEFSLELSKLHTYDDVVTRVAQHLGLDDPSKIRLTSHNCYYQQPKPQPIKHWGIENLSDMLVHYKKTSDILYYEVLDLPLPELQSLKTLKIAFQHATKDEVVIHTIRLPKQCAVEDVINDLKTKVDLSHPNVELRLLEVFYHKIYKIFSPNENIENINDQYWTLRAEEIPEEEKNLGPNDRLIQIYHFMKDKTQKQLVQNFGDPFFLVIHEGETLADVKLRIQKKLQVPDEKFSKWKFAFVSLGCQEYLLDSDVVCSRFQRRDIYGAWEQYLGLEHTDNTPTKSYAVNQTEIDRNIIVKSEADIVGTDPISEDKLQVSPSNPAHEIEDLILEELMKVTSETDIEDKGLSYPVNKSIQLETVQEQIPHQSSSQTPVEKPKLFWEAKKAAKWMIEILGQTDDNMVNQNEINVKLSIITSCFIENRFPSHYVKQAESFPIIIQNLFKGRDKIRELKNQTAKLEEETKELSETEEKMNKRCLRYEEILQDASSKLEVLQKKEEELITELISIRQKIAENIERRGKLEKPFIKSQVAKKEFDEKLSKVISDKHEKQKTLEVTKQAEIEEIRAFEKVLDGKTKLKLIFEQLLAEYSD